MPITPVNTQILADQVADATDLFPAIWTVAGTPITVSATDANLDRTENETGFELLSDIQVLVLNDRISSMGITYQTKGEIYGIRVRVQSIMLSSDGKTTTFMLRQDREKPTPTPDP